MSIGGIMANILWVVVGTTGLVWAVSTLATGILALRAHRGDPRVVIDDPWESERAQHDLARLRAAMARARGDAAAREADFTRWERDLDRPGPRVDRIAPRRPRPAA
jgi:hypothetical protein